MDIMNKESSFHSSDTLVVVDPSRRRRRLVIAGAIAAVVLVLVLVAVLGRGSGDKQAKQDAANGAGQVPTVSVVVPGRSDIGRVVTASGPLAAKRDQPVGIAGQGGRVVRVLVDAGSWVRAGQVLAVVDRSVQTQLAAQIAAQVEAAKANAALAQSNYERAIALKDRGFVSTAEIESKKAARDAAFAQVRVAQAQLGATRAQIGQPNGTAPTSGLVLSRNVEVGQIASPASGALFHLAAGGPVEVRAQLSHLDLGYLHSG